MQEAVHLMGLRDDTTCIVVDVLPPEKLTPPVPPSKRQGMGIFKFMFRRKSCETSTHSDRELSEADLVEEIFEDGSAKLAQRYVYNGASDVHKFSFTQKTNHLIHL